ncbi:MAG: uroporphyrinogen-III synthase, partial [bacterium]|nr:uroporphyrinogen-III synthase [bacterium]
AEACIVNAAQAGSAAPNAAIMLETEFAMPSELAEEAGKLAAQTLMSGCQAHSLMPAPEPPRQTIPMQKICLKPCRPLAGKTAVILRSPDEAEPFIKALETLGAKALAYPVIRCEPLSKQEIPQDLLAEFAEKPQSFQAIVFASRRSPELTLKALGDKARKLPVFCTGDSTAASALKCGYPKERIIVPHRHDATGIIEAMRSHFGMNACPCASEERTSKPDELSAALGTSAPQKPAATAPRIIITMPQGTDHLAQAAEKAGFQVARLPLYRTVPLKEAPALAPAPPALATATSVHASQPPTLTSVVPDLIMAFSPSALESFFRLSNISPQSAHIAAIGKSTAAAAEKLGCTDIAISPLPEPQHFLKTVFQYLTSYK